MKTKERIIDDITDNLHLAMSDPFPEKRHIKSAVRAIIDLMTTSAGEPAPATPGEVLPIPSYHINGEDYVLARHYKHLHKAHEELAQWKEAALVVREWWSKVDDYVREHRSVGTLGQKVSDVALRLIKERDGFATAVEEQGKVIAELKQDRDRLANGLEGAKNMIKYYEKKAENLTEHVKSLHKLL